MSIKARVGRHTQKGGLNCQNLPEDQKTVIDLLNRVSAANGGAGGRLKAQIKNGTASDELYAAIVTFEAKQTPGQRNGFIDPGGKLMALLGMLASISSLPIVPLAGPSVAPHHAVAKAAAPPLPSQRKLTSGEIKMLRKVFSNTLHYSAQEIGVNSLNVGGEDNSITLFDKPRLTTGYWCADFSDEKVSYQAKSTFVHEFVHVWQFYHGVTKLSAAWLWLSNWGDYEQAYPYNLSKSNDLLDYNIEQQASIIEDFWRLTNGHPISRNNKGKERSKSSYNNFADQVQSVGVPFTPAQSTRALALGGVFPALLNVVMPAASWSLL